MKEKVELLKWMLEDVREETLKGLSTLTEEQLFESALKNEFPIGAYVMHLCECDIHWLEVISGSVISDEMKQRCYFDKWFDPSGESSPPKNILKLEEYSSALRDTRKMFLDYVGNLNDEELDDTVVMKSKRGDLNISKKWIIYHIIEHEAHHRGQIFLLMRQSGWKNQHQLTDRKTVWWLKD